MQDLSTGELKPLEPRFFEGIEKLSRQEQIARLQEAADAVIPDRNNQGPMFGLGELLEIRGGRFKIISINPKKRTISLQSIATFSGA